MPLAFTVARFISFSRKAYLLLTILQVLSKRIARYAVVTTGFIAVIMCNVKFELYRRSVKKSQLIELRTRYYLRPYEQKAS